MYIVGGVVIGTSASACTCNLQAALQLDAIIPTAPLSFAVFCISKAGLLPVEQLFKYADSNASMSQPCKARQSCVLHMLFSSLPLFIAFPPVVDIQQLQVICTCESTEPSEPYVKYRSAMKNLVQCGR